MSFTRRKFIQKTTYFGIAACLLTSNSVLAEWPESIFTKDDQEGVIKGLFGQSEIQETNEIFIRVPEIAENGAVVPVSVKTSLNNVESISLLVDKNPKPLAAQFIVNGADKSHVSTRLKLAEATDVVAIVKADGKLYRTSKFVKVTIGGCGGGGL